MLTEADECTQKIAKHLKDMIVAAQDSDTLQAQAKTVELEKMLMEQKLNQEQAAAAKAHAKQLEFEKQKWNSNSNTTKKSGHLKNRRAWAHLMESRL